MFLVIRVKYCLHDGSGKYVLQLIPQTMHHSISTLRGPLPNLVESFKLKERLGKLVADSRKYFAKRGAKRIKASKGSKGTRTVLSLPGGI